MTCRICRVPTTENTCNVCNTFERAPRRFCAECHAPLDDPGWLGRFCRLCNSMYETVRANRWLNRAQADWIHENFQLARNKRSLLGHGTYELPEGSTEGTEQP